MSELHDIIRRLEGGETGREIDLAALEAVGASIFGEVLDWRWPDGEPVADLDISTSLDAAAELHERLCPGKPALLDFRDTYANAEILEYVDMGCPKLFGFSENGAGHHAAAWTAAILKAWAEMEGRGDG